MKKFFLTPEEIAEQQRNRAVAEAKRLADAAARLKWWKEQERLRIEGFNIVTIDPMYIKINQRYQERKLKELKKCVV